MRTLGLELLAASVRYEGLVVRDATTASVAGLVARQRRLLQAAYRLLDGGDLLEAQKADSRIPAPNLTASVCMGGNVIALPLKREWSPRARHRSKRCTSTV
jgi:hypothetical protein